MKIGFIGCGNMGGALAKSAVKTLGGDNVLVLCKTKESTEARARELSATPSEIGAIATECRLIFLGVKPHMIADAIESILPFLKDRDDEYAVVSMAAGVSLDALSKMLGEGVSVIRMMPNTAVAVGKGMTVFDHRATESDLEAFRYSMSASGEVDMIPEELIDAATAVMGCGPAFAYQFADAIAEGGVACGLKREDAVRYAAVMMLGAAEMILSGEKAPRELRDAVCSPGGSTIEGVRFLEQNGFCEATLGAVAASFEKTKKLGEK